MSVDDCNTKFSKNAANELKRLRYNKGITVELICAWNKETGADVCRGDSGSPLTYFDYDTNVHKILGITSAGLPCGGASKFPGIYARVANNMEWIESIVFKK